MTDIGVIGLVLIIANLIFSYKGFNNQLILDSYKFDVDKILIQKDYKRLLTSGFLHVSWNHILFNMVSLYAFSSSLESLLGELNFLIVYFVSLIGGNLFALFVHRNHGDYSAVGASGAISGIVFASIALFPGLEISLLIFPIYIPSWLFGILFVVYSIFAIKSNKDNIGHEAHLGGAIIGMITAIIIHPVSLMQNYLPILLITVPTIGFIYLVLTKPHFLIVDNVFSNKPKKHYNIDHEYNEQKVQKENELDKILDKISAKGINKLTVKEKQKLEEYSNK